MEPGPNPVAFAPPRRMAPPVGNGAIRTLGAIAGVFALSFLAYLPALHAGFIWNDAEYVTAPGLRSWHGLGRIWWDVGVTEQYYPLLHSAFWVEHRLWGDASAGYHVMNVLLHAAAACMFAAVLRRLAVPGAWLAAILFALHPVMVESVAWIAEQKNTLSTLFCLLAAWVYLDFEDTRRPGRYALASGLFVAALLSKSVTATLPAALLVIRWWRAGRLEWRRDVMPLLPWFAAGALMGVVSAWVERTFIGARGAEFALDAGQRVLLAGRIIWFYLGKLCWPADLIFIYPRWTVDATQAWQWLFPVAAVAGGAGLWALRRWSRAPLAVFLLFVGLLFPTLGFFNVYGFLYSYVADHWQYLAALPVIALAAAGFSRWAERFGPSIRVVAVLLWVGPLAMASHRQSTMYADMQTFYTATLARNPDCWMAHNNLGTLLREHGERDGARAHFEAALQIRPDLAKVHNNLGSVLLDGGDRAGAATHFARAVELEPDYAIALNNLGNVRRESGRVDEAIALFEHALRVDPGFADARNNLGVALRNSGRVAAAIVEFERVVRESPRFAPAHLNLALCYSIQGRNAEAMEQYREARRLNPALPELRGP